MDAEAQYKKKLECYIDVCSIVSATLIFCTSITFGLVVDYLYFNDGKYPIAIIKTVATTLGMYLTYAMVSRMQRIHIIMLNQEIKEKDEKIAKYTYDDSHNASTSENITYQGYAPIYQGLYYTGNKGVPSS